MFLKKDLNSNVDILFSNLTAREMNNSTSNALVLYVSQETWIRSILEGKTSEKPKSCIEETQEEEEDFSNYKFEDDIVYLRSLDPKEWKEQDHYAVLGIKDLRIRATEDVLKRACK